MPTRWSETFSKSSAAQQAAMLLPGLRLGRGLAERRKDRNKENDRKNKSARAEGAKAW